MYTISTVTRFYGANQLTLITINFHLPLKFPFCNWINCYIPIAALPPNTVAQNLNAFPFSLNKTLESFWLSLFSFTHVTIKTNYLYYGLLTPDLSMPQKKGPAQFISI